MGVGRVSLVTKEGIMTRRSGPVRLALSMFLTVAAVLVAGTAVTTAAPAGDARSGHAPISKAARKDKPKKQPGQDRHQQMAFKGAATRLSQSGVTCEGDAPP